MWKETKLKISILNIYCIYFTMKPTYTFLPTIILILMMFFLFPITSNGETRIQCSNVVGAVRPCVVFFRGGSGVTGMPPAACCAGVSTLSKMAAAKNRQAVCRCVQSAIKNLRATDATVKALPRRCGVTLPFTFSPNVKCPG
nr:non-specific lipid-transfer protein 1-like [Nicotiana tomentosiformis]XP_016488973.1 PREDICTED: non-specific lipid-transfer protein 1-like isoform X2 [Nicotiana tabacum]